ncbi:PREDICTED: zinc finger protein 568-like [Nicrophorus vespilloides]|uniref:Zinc finger protein 568-like n=1 Tax=Nicrophorus vespilloides TaxID=110193 RepID=A0ABM1N319_NICVS|nr:PREDICTED: zinc finger protein 568-like [Nicrophorus vespilloides]
MDDRADALRAMQICRFCLDEKGPFTNIYVKDSRDGKQSTPLPLQIMACVAIEVFCTDGMPQLICNPCRSQTIGAYNFKTTCKKSDDALKLFLATGNLNKPNSRRSCKRERSGSTEKIRKSRRILSSPVPDEEVEAKKVEILELVNDEVTEYKLDEDAIILDDDTMEDKCLSSEENTCGMSSEKAVVVETAVFPCSECERSFPLQQLLELHMKNHGRERCFQCDECERKFFTKYDLAKHKATHTTMKPFECAACGKQFARESLLHRHEKIHVDLPKYLCSHCERTFLTREDLDNHSEKHKKVRPYTCRVCDKGFVFKQGLERHEMTHADEKPHKCNYCEASFTSPIKLTRHITSHAGLRPYPCKLCGRTFLLSHHLTRHMRSHYANKSLAVEPVGQHKCDVCSMSFRRKDSLINHSAIHSMVNLKCVICNTAFQNAQEVKDHITTHLAGLPFPCDKCDYSFESHDQLEEHELKHAEMEYEEQIEQEVSQEARNDVIEFVEEEFEDDDEITEFTITNDNDDNPLVVPSPRKGKSKSYNQFLNSEFDGEMDQHETMIVEETDFPSSDTLMLEEIKPIVRSEGTKVYTRKSIAEKPKLPDLKSNESFIGSSSSSSSGGTLQLDSIDLNHEMMKDLPDRQFVDMKIGEKTVRVQKLIMTKAEIEAMAKQGKIEIKGDTIIFNNNGRSLKETPKNITIEGIIDDPKPMVLKPPIMKTYVKKTPKKQ